MSLTLNQKLEMIKLRGKGKEFEEGKLTLEEVVAYAKQNGEPKQVSGKQELYEAIVNMYC